MDTSSAASRNEGRQLAITRARSLAAFYTAGGVLNVVSAAIPNWKPAHPWGLFTIAAVALATAGGLVAGGARVSARACHLLVALGSALIAACMASVGAGPMTLAYAFFFTFVAVYAGNWFSERQVAAHLVVALTLEALALWQVGDARVLLPGCIVSMGACTAAAAVVLRLQQRLRMLAECDPLTAAANRRGLDALLQRHTRDGVIRVSGTEPLVLIALDLDGFKAYNDAHGHARGDALLRDCATGWRGLLGPGELCARLGGDEFLLVCRRRPADAEELLTELRRVVPLPLRVSAGVATAYDGESMATVLACADAALYADKATAAVTALPRPRADLSVVLPQRDVLSA